MAKTVPPAENVPSLRSYITGFLLSLYLTITSYLLVTHNLLHGGALLLAIGGLAFVQFFIQSIYFLHIGEDKKPRWKSLMFGFMIIIVAILVGGSLWIMTHLDQHHYSSEDTKAYLHNHEGL